MAWIAALISGGIGLAGSSASNKSAKKGVKNASTIDSAGYRNALKGIGPYQDIGGKAAESLAQLMGLEGYRTPEEIAYTNWLKQSPVAPEGIKQSYDSSRDWLTGGPQRGILGDTVAGELSPNSVQMNAIIPGLGSAVTRSVFKRSDKKSRAAAAAAAAQNAANAEKYKQDVAAWESRKNELLSSSKRSLEGYDPTAALRNTAGYTSRYNEGLNTALNNMTGARKSGNALRSLTEFGQGFASNERTNEFNRLASIAGLGQNATTTAGNWAIGQGGNQANLQLLNAQNDSNYYQNLNNIGQGTISNYLNYRNRQNRPQVAHDMDY